MEDPEYSRSEAIELQNQNDSPLHQPSPLTIEEESIPTITKATYLKLSCAGYAFFCAGINDGSLGPLIPYILRSYTISTSLVSVIYGTTFFGWLFVALTNSHFCQILDLGALLTLGASFQLLAHVLRAWLPPFGVYVTSFFFASLGQAFQDTHGNTFVSTIKGAHRWLSFIHAMYMGGCLVGPFVATAVASADKPSRWNLFYIFPLGLCVINVILTPIAFRDTFALKRGLAKVVGSPEQGSKNSRAFKEIKEILYLPSVWLLSLYFFFFLGVAITAGGWVVEYLVEVRKGDLSTMGYVPAGYSGGCFLGRIFLAEPTYRWGERRMIFIYIVLCLGLQLCFWLIPNIIAGAVTISFLGFFSGPFFATGISVGSKLFPKHIQSSALAFVFVLGQIGGSVFPAITGVIAAHAGVRVLQPILVGLIAATGVSWLLVPRSELHRE